MLSRFDLVSLATAVAIPLGGGFLGAQVTVPEVKHGHWYKDLKKPSWNPPNWLFAPVWSALYVCMGTASWLVWRQGGFARNALPLSLYAANVAFNLLWSPMFFKYHKLGLSLGVLGGIWTTGMGCWYTFGRVDVWAGRLLVPYLCWASFAGVLNWWIWRENPNNGEGKKDRQVFGQERKAPQLAGGRNGEGDKKKGSSCCVVQ